MSRNPIETTKAILSSWLDIGFKLGLALGALISWIFFSFFVNTLPSLGSIGDIAIYLISISAWSIIVAFYVIAISIASSFLIKTSSNYINYPSNSFINYYFGFPFLSIVVLIGFKYFHLTQQTINVVLSFLFFLAPIVYSLFVNEFRPAKNKNRMAWFIDRITNIGLPLILFSLVLFLIALMLDNFFNSLYNQAFIYLLFIIIIIFINYFIIKDELKNWKIALGIAISYLVITSIIFAALKIDNPMIVQPFKLLKLGYYKTELHFKEDFINKANPFPLNETNQTSNTFFVLSSVGDEYIIKEIKYAHYVADNNISHNQLFPFTYCDELYYCEDENFSKVWKLNDKDQLIRLKNVPLDFNLSIKKEFNRWKQWKEPIYRIKKDNIEFEIIGKDFESRSTIWKSKSIKEPKPSKGKTKENPNKATKKCIQNIPQTCYCSYPNNNLSPTSRP